MDKSSHYPKEEKERDDLIFDLIRARYETEQEAITNLDNKAGNLIGLTGVVVGFLLGTSAIQISSLLMNPALSIVYFIGVGVLLLSIFWALYSVKIRKWSVVPDVRTLIQKYTTLPYSVVLRRNAGELVKAVEKAEQQNKEKARLINLSWTFLIAGLSIVFIFYVLVVTLGAIISR